MKLYCLDKKRRKSIAAQSLFHPNALHLRLYVTLLKEKPVTVQALFSQTSASEYKDPTSSKIQG